MAGAPISIANIAPLYDGRYMIKSVEHEFEKQGGYKTRIETNADLTKGSKAG